MRSRSRRSLFLSTACLFLAVAALVGCGKKTKAPEPEVRLPRMSNLSADASGANGFGSQAGVDQNQFGSSSWAPGGGAPAAGSLNDPSMMTKGFDAAGAAAKDGATGDYTNSASTDGVEDGTFVSELEMIHFQYDSSDISDEFKTVLDEHAGWINQNGAVMVQVEGHCDERGTEEYNVSLGQKRADAVRSYLIEKGVDANRLSTISYGKLRPLSFDQNEESHMLNRRAMFLVYEGGAQGVASAN